MPGGGPANIAVGLARLGASVAFAGRFSKHGLGPWLMDHVRGSGADVSFSVACEEPATIALVTMAEDGGATYAFYGPETSDWHWSEDELPSIGALASHTPPVVALHTGSLATALAPGAEVIGGWLRHLRQQSDLVVSYDPNVRLGLVPADQLTWLVERFVSLADLVKVSEDDIAALYPGKSVETVVADWTASGPSVVVVTMGKDGASAWSSAGVHCRRPAPRIEVADTIGAGDSFMSALLAYLHERGQLERATLAGLSASALDEALEWATAASAITCTRTGADPPGIDELEIFLGERRAAGS